MASALGASRADSTPSVPIHTARDDSSSAVIVTTASAPIAASRALAQTFAPFGSSARAFSRFRLNTATACPAAIIRAAIPLPMRPRPMNATLNLMVLCLALAAQAIAASEDAPRNEIFHNDRVTVELEQIPPQQETPARRSDLASIVIPLNGTHAGEVRFRARGFVPEVRNDEAETLRTVIIELIDPQGQAISEQVPIRRYCAEASRIACVEETHLFCTLKVCADEVKMGPHATRSGFATDADQMLVALSDYKLTAIGAETPANASHARQSGQVEWVPAGAPNRWTNETTATMRFVVIRFSPNR